MKPLQLDHEFISTEDSSAENTTPPSCPEIDGIDDDPPTRPRVGDKYQAEIPVLTSSKFERHQLLVNLFGSEGEDDVSPSQLAGEVNLDQLHGINDYFPVPSSLNKPWSDAEVDAFVLGLHIFGKNFVQVKKFMDNREMGEILSFYYGEFYGCEGYRRWSGCRKMQRRKRVSGKKIFTGSRHKKLLSRLVPYVPEQSQMTLAEVSTEFTNGRTSLEHYVLSLRAMVGLPILVEAVGIGKGKADLTAVATEPVKSKPSPIHILPSGNAYASITPTEIIKLLNGNSRLSKARSNDIFFEAVWPLLLAQGWHSETLPTTKGLVFLVPGVEKFSSKELVKGNHYFDSIIDVLTKVASEPELLEELKDEEALDNNSDRNLPDLEDPSVAHSQTSTCDINLQKSNVLEQGEELSNIVREMRCSSCQLRVSNELVPVVKRRRLSACLNTMTNDFHHDISGDSGPKEVCPCHALISKEVGHNAFQVGFSEEKLSSNSGGFSTANADKQMPDGETMGHERPLSIDLNFPHKPLGFQSSELMTVEVEDTNANNTSADVTSQAEQPKMITRRQSTRNRPLSTKALEAIECELLGAKERKRRSKVSTQEATTSSRSLRVRNKGKSTLRHSKVTIGNNMNAEAQRDANGEKNFVGKA